ncbi:MAG: hypothetical protein NTY51_09685, partial [Deltaproteobacteria bacterium]|nr:hypothetical protein [Deltaproteobacteria bacterium]
MLRRCLNYLCILTVLLMVGVTGASAESNVGAMDAYAAASLDASPNYKTISKVKPSEPVPTKVRPGIMSRLEGLSRFSPTSWGDECILPSPAQGQFVVGPRVLFGRVRGEARRTIGTTVMPGTAVDFNENLGLSQKGSAIWGLDAQYQLRPRFGLRYSFTPIKMD